jgi:hypothetical protein
MNEIQNVPLYAISLLLSIYFLFGVAVGLIFSSR